MARRALNIDKFEKEKQRRLDLLESTRVEVWEAFGVKEYNGFFASLRGIIQGSENNKQLEANWRKAEDAFETKFARHFTGAGKATAFEREWSFVERIEPFFVPKSKAKESPRRWRLSVELFRDANKILQTPEVGPALKENILGLTADEQTAAIFLLYDKLAISPFRMGKMIRKSLSELESMASATMPGQDVLGQHYATLSNDKKTLEDQNSMLARALANSRNTISSLCIKDSKLGMIIPEEKAERAYRSLLKVIDAAEKSFPKRNDTSLVPGENDYENEKQKIINLGKSVTADLMKQQGLSGTLPETLAQMMERIDLAYSATLSQVKELSETPLQFRESVRSNLLEAKMSLVENMKTVTSLPDRIKLLLTGNTPIDSLRPLSVTEISKVERQIKRLQHELVSLETTKDAKKDFELFIKSEIVAVGQALGEIENLKPKAPARQRG